MGAMDYTVYVSNDAGHNHEGQMIINMAMSKDIAVNLVRFCLRDSPETSKLTNIVSLVLGGDWDLAEQLIGAALMAGVLTRTEREEAMDVKWVYGVGEKCEAFCEKAAAEYILRNVEYAS